jgi:hypothetical protein
MNSVIQRGYIAASVKLGRSRSSRSLQDGGKSALEASGSPVAMRGYGYVVYRLRSRPAYYPTRNYGFPIVMGSHMGAPKLLGSVRSRVRPEVSGKLGRKLGRRG